MLEFVVLLTFIGLVFSSLPRYGPGNPFQIYFLVWFLVYFGYLLTRSSWITPSGGFFLALLAIDIFWLASFVAAAPYLRDLRVDPRFAGIHVNGKLVSILQLACVVMLPFAYAKALALSGGENIFGVLGYSRLRLATLEGGRSLGQYFGLLSLVISSVSLVLFKDRRITLLRLALSLLVSLCYAYLTTGRTYFLLFFALHLFPLILTRRIGFRGVLIGACALLSAFVLVATMTAKGISTQSDLAGNLSALMVNMRSYTIAPLLAFSTMFENPPPPAWGAHTFRSILAVLHAIGVSDVQPPALIREWVNVPDPTNVYTVYDPYFRDFGGFGFIVLILIAGLHVHLYRRAVAQRGVYLFLYSASAYALIMQFFQDQYFSLLSMWMQLAFWYWLAVDGNRVPELTAAHSAAFPANSRLLETAAANPASPLDVVLVNWNSGSQLRLALDSVLSDEDRIGQTNIFVVDNGSRDDSLNGLDQLPRVQVLRNDRNLGFGAACNQGAALGGGEFILFLNPDATVFPNTIRQSVDFMRRPENLDVGICGVQLVDAAGTVQKSCARFPDAMMYLAQAFGLAAVFPSRYSHFMTAFDHRETRTVDHVMGAYFLIRRSLFESLGGFDERFFVYLEDLDFSLRAKRSGWRSVFFAQARAYHKGGGVSDQVRAQRLFYSLRSRMLYAFKHFNRTEAWAVCFATLAIEPLPRLLRGLLRLSRRELTDTVHGFALLWWGLPGTLRRALRA